MNADAHRSWHAEWRELRAHGTAPHCSPSPRSGHAMTLLTPSESVLLFGGSDGKVFFDDFYLLEPRTYEQPEKQQRRALNEPHSEPPVPSESTKAKALPYELQWKKLLVSCHSTYRSQAVASSLDSDPGRSELPHVGAGRDYHSMHYVPEREDERQGFRVLVVGNVIVSSDEEGMNSTQSFEMDELRIEEVRVQQPLLEAHWNPCTVNSMWKPSARQAHCSVLVGDQLFCFGGKNATSTCYFNDIFYFDIRLRQWKKPTSNGAPPSPRAYADMTCNRSKLFVYGGYDGRQQFGGMYSYDLELNRWDKIITTGDKPATRINHSMTYIEPHHVVLFGGRKRTTRKNDLFILDVMSCKWIEIAEQKNSTSSSTYPLGRAAHSTVVVASQFDEQTHRYDAKLVIYGGYAGGLKWLNDLYALDISSVRSSDVQKAAQTLSSSQCESVSQTSIADADGSAICPPPTQHHPSAIARNPVGSTAESSQGSTSVLNDITNVGSASVTNAGSSSTYVPVAANVSSLLRIRRPQRVEVHDREVNGNQLSTIQSPQPKKRRRGIVENQKSQDNEPEESLGARVVSRSSSAQSKDLERTVEMLKQLLENEHTAREQMLAEIHQNRTLMGRQASELSRKVDCLEKQVKVNCDGRSALVDQLQAAAWALEAQQRVIADTFSAATNRILAIVQKTSQQQYAVSALLESKISSLHDAVSEIRHLSGDRTEIEESPEKGHCQSNSSLCSPKANEAADEEVERLKAKLHATTQDNQKLQLQVQTLEGKLRIAEENARKIQDLSSAWLDHADKE